MAYAAGAYLPTKTRPQASLQRALVSKSAATKVAYIQSHFTEQQKHKRVFYFSRCRNERDRAWIALFFCGANGNRKLHSNNRSNVARKEPW